MNYILNTYLMGFLIKLEPCVCIFWEHGEVGPSGTRQIHARVPSLKTATAVEEDSLAKERSIDQSMNIQRRRVGQWPMR